MIDADDAELVVSIKRHEGYSAHIYLCPAGKRTIGYGYNLESGMTMAEGEALLKCRLHDVLAELNRYPWFDHLTGARQRALAEMGYQLGMGGLRKFKRMLHALSQSDYEAAAAEMMDSRWARQTPTRAESCSWMMRRG